MNIGLTCVRFTETCLTNLWYRLKSHISTSCSQLVSALIVVLVSSTPRSLRRRPRLSGRCRGCWGSWKAPPPREQAPPVKTKQTFYRRAYVMHIWNKLPENCRSAATLSSFKSRLKTFLFANAFINYKFEAFDSYLSLHCNVYSPVLSVLF